MSHQPFETYLLADAKLTNEQQLSLDLHLKECDQCTALSFALASLDTILLHNPSPKPAPAFTQRWQARLSKHQQARQNRKFWLMALSVLLLACLTMIIMFIINFSQINWSYELTQAIARISVVAAQVKQFSQIIGRFTNRSPFLLPMVVVFGVGIFSSILMLFITWFGTIIRLYSAMYEKGNIS